MRIGSLKLRFSHLHSLAVLIILISLTTFSHPAEAFGVIGEDGHRGITKDALTIVSASADGKHYTFSEAAILEIIAGNVETDLHQLTPQFHFDNETFFGATTRLVNLKEDIITKITADDPSGNLARFQLGGALHTLQDFYAHSNWIELGNKAVNIAGINTGGIDTRLGRSIYAGLDLSVKTSVDGDPGTLLPTLNELTSGWFSLTSCTPQPGKVRHGFGLIGCPTGLNKDKAEEKPFLHKQAYDRAVSATLDYVGQILEDGRVAGNAKAIRALMGVITLDLALVIDTTGSMTDDIDFVKTSSKLLIEGISLISSDFQVSLVTYKDHPVSPYGDAGDYPSRVESDFTPDTAAIINAINGISVSGGGDEPEAVYSGIMASVGLHWRAGATKIIVVLGDAPAHDPEPVTGLTLPVVEDAAYNLDPAKICPVLLRDRAAAAASFEALAKGSGCEVTKASSSTQVVDAILAAIRTGARPVIPPAPPAVASAPSAPLPLCADVAGNTNPIVRANIASGAVSSGGIYCHVVAQNGQFNPAVIGNQNVLNLGVRQAVDVFALAGDGSPITRFNAPVMICLQGEGSMIFLDAQQSPRVPQPIAVRYAGGFSCANIQTAGTLVLVNANLNVPAAPAASAQTASSHPLNNCRVTTTHMVNLRSAPDTNSAEITVLPYNISYQATERLPGWYRIIYSNTQGWVSESYVNTQGNCD